jgi:hypothetical protein
MRPELGIYSKSSHILEIPLAFEQHKDFEDRKQGNQPEKALEISKE